MRRILSMAAGALALALWAAGVGAEEVKLSHGGRTLNANLETTDSWPAGPVILMTHGTLAHRSMEIIAGLQGMFRDRGLSSLAINLSLGLDDRPAAMYDCPVPHTHKHTDAVDEIGAWVGWLKGKGVEKLVLLGHSRGGNQTARYAVQHPDPAVVLVALLAPPTRDEVKDAAYYHQIYGKDLAPLLDRARAMAARGEGGAFMEHVDFIYCKDTKATAAAFLSYHGPDEKMHTPRLVPEIKAPVVVFAGSEDHSFPDLIPETEPLADGERVRLVVLDGADHFFRDLFSEDIADIVTDLLGH